MKDLSYFIVHDQLIIHEIERVRAGRVGIADHFLDLKVKMKVKNKWKAMD